MASHPSRRVNGGSQFALLLSAMHADVFALATLRRHALGEALCGIALSYV